MFNKIADPFFGPLESVGEVRSNSGKGVVTVYVQDGAYHIMTGTEYTLKLRAESHIDELSEASHGNGKLTPDAKKHSFAKDGFEYRTAFLPAGRAMIVYLFLSVKTK